MTGRAQLLVVWTVLAAWAVLAGGCSHTFYQFRVDANELNAIGQAKNALAATAANPNALAQVVDLDGRRASEALIAGMTVESTSGDEQYQRLSRALYLAVMGDADDPLSAFNPDTAVLAARFGQRLVGNTLGQFGLGGIASMVGVVGDDDGQRLREMQVSLARGQVGTCGPYDVIVSYDAGILGHIHTQLAEQDPIYLQWRDRVRAIHLVRFTCSTQHMLTILTRNRDEAGLRVIGWHFLSQAQWDAMRPELRRAFDLPN